MTDILSSFRCSVLEGEYGVGGSMTQDEFIDAAFAELH